LYPSRSGKRWKLSVCDQAIFHLQAFTGGRYGENPQMHQNRDEVLVHLGILGRSRLAGGQKTDRPRSTNALFHAVSRH
jgi:hypothetical protein